MNLRFHHCKRTLFTNSRLRLYTTSTNETSKHENTPGAFLASLPPLKRILCLCPVPFDNGENNDSANEPSEINTFLVGMAISDPYLAYAVPIEACKSSKLGKGLIKGYLSPVPPDRSGVESGARVITWEGSPQDSGEFLDQVGYNDVGAVVFGSHLTMKQSKGRDVLNRDLKCETIECVIQKLRDEMEGILSAEYRQNYDRKFIFLDLNDTLEDQLTLNDAKNMAAEEPEMWEEISLNDEIITPSTHAAAHLNAFLWKHTGGWRNTFA